MKITENELKKIVKKSLIQEKINVSPETIEEIVAGLLYAFAMVEPLKEAAAKLMALPHSKMIEAVELTCSTLSSYDGFGEHKSTVDKACRVIGKGATHLGLSGLKIGAEILKRIPAIYLLKATAAGFPKTYAGRRAAKEVAALELKDKKNQKQIGNKKSKQPASSGDTYSIDGEKKVSKEEFDEYQAYQRKLMKMAQREGTARLTKGQLRKIIQEEKALILAEQAGRGAYTIDPQAYEEAESAALDIVESIINNYGASGEVVESIVQALNDVAQMAANDSRLQQ